MSLLLALQGAATQTLTRDESIPVDSNPPAAVALTCNAQIPVESLQSLVLSVGIAIEAGGSNAGLAAIPVESLQSLRLDSTVPVEDLGSQRFDGSIPVEDLASQRFDGTVPIDTTAVEVVVPVFDRDVFDETVFATGIQLDRDESIPIEGSVNIVTLNRDEAIPVETFFRVINRDEGIPVENPGQPLGRQRPTRTQFIAWFQGSAVLQVDQGGDFAKYFQKSPVLTLEARILLELGETVPIEDLASKVAEHEIPVEDLQFLQRDDEIPVESINVVAALVRDETIPIDALGSLVRDDEIPVETPGVLVSDHEIPVETLGSLTRDGEIPIDAQPQRFDLTRDEAIPVEALTGVTRDAEIPIDSVATPLFALDRDESIPIDAAFTPVVPGGFMALLGGGAPWPPSWLVRAPLLNRTQHDAVIYLGGTSWARFTGTTPPNVPATLVPTKPKRVRIRRPAPAHPGYVRAAHSAIIWVGGRSTESTRIDPDAVRRQDEDDIMTLLPLL